MNINKLKGKMVENEINVEMLANYMECHPSSLYRKFENPDKITIGDAAKIRKFVPMTDADAYDIFLAQ